MLEVISQTIEGQKVDACYGDLVYVDKNNPDRIVRYWKSQSYRDGLFERGWMPAHPTFYVKKWVYEKYGGYDLAYRRQSDFELTVRFLAVHKIKSAYIPKVLVRMRSGGASRGTVAYPRGQYRGVPRVPQACAQRDAAFYRQKNSVTGSAVFSSGSVRGIAIDE